MLTGSPAEDLEAAQAAFLASSSEIVSAEARADVLLACMAGASSPAATLADTLSVSLPEVHCPSLFALCSIFSKGSNSMNTQKKQTGSACDTAHCLLKDFGERYKFAWSLGPKRVSTAPSADKYFRRVLAKSNTGVRWSW